MTPLASVRNPAATPFRVTTKYHDMTSRNTRFSCRIGRRADKQGPRSPARTKAGIEKYAIGTNSPQNKVPEENHAEDIPQRGLLTTNTENPPKRTRKKWTRDEYKEIMEAYNTSTIRPSETNTTVDTYNIWRRQNPTKRTYLDANKPANVRRDKDFEIEIARMWGMRTETVPVIVGALGLIREGMDQNLGKIPGTSNINEL